MTWRLPLRFNFPVILTLAFTQLAVSYSIIAYSPGISCLAEIFILCPTLLWEKWDDTSKRHSTPHPRQLLLQLHCQRAQRLVSILPLHVYYLLRLMLPGWLLILILALELYLFAWATIHLLIIWPRVIVMECQEEINLTLKQPSSALWWRFLYVNSWFKLIPL